MTISSTGTGAFTGTIRKDGKAIDYELTYQDTQSAVTQAHIHFGGPATTGGIVLFLCTNLGNAPGTVPAPQACPSAPATIKGTLTAADVIAVAGQGIHAGATGFADILQALRAGAAYVNVHTTDHPTGEIRQQLSTVSNANVATPLLCNDVFWNICAAGSVGSCDSTNAAFLGQSSFNLSCSDPDMNGAEDCGKLEGNNSGGIIACLPGNSNASCINLWSLAGMTGPIGSPASASLDCSAPPAPYTCTTPITSLTMTWTGSSCVRIGGLAGLTPFDIDNICPGDTVVVAGYDCQ